MTLYIEAEFVRPLIKSLIALLLVSGYLFLLLLYNKNKRKLAETKAQLAEIENARLSVEAENLALEKEKFMLLVDNLLKERHELRQIIEQDADNTMLEPLKKRSQMLDKFFVSELSENPQLSRDYAKWVNELITNRQELFKEMRVTFKANHPTSYAFLSSKGLTDTEMTYICLYALGLRANEVGIVMSTSRHYNVNTEIRQKLGLTPNGPNLTTYVKSLLKDLG